MSELPLDVLARRLADHAEVLCEELLPGGKRIGTEWRAGSVYGEAGSGKHGGSLAVELQGRKRGRWADWANPDEHKGDLLHLVAFHFEISLGDAAAWARRWLGLGGGGARPRSSARGPRPRRPALPPDPGEAREARGKRYFARQIWRQAVPLADTPGERYLRSRGLAIAPPPTLRFQPRLMHHPTKTRWPAIVAAVQAPDGSLAGVWRTYLDHDCRDKAPIDPVRMGLAAAPGCALRLGPAGAGLALAEGWENGLAIMEALPGTVVWCGLSGNGLLTMVLPPEVNRPRIFPDWDRRRLVKGKWKEGAGQIVARALKRRLLRERRSPSIVWPPGPGMDFNDVLLGVSA